MNKNDAQNDALWEPCPSGKIQTVIDQTAPTLRQPPAGCEGAVDRRGLLKIAAAVAVGAGAAVLTYRLSNPTKPRMNSTVLAGISCAEVYEKLPEYIDQSIEDRELTTKIGDHLKLCSHCLKAYEQMKESSIS